MTGDDYDRHEDGYVLASIALREQQQRALREQRTSARDGEKQRQAPAQQAGGLHQAK